MKHYAIYGARILCDFRLPSRSSEMLLQRRKVASYGRFGTTHWRRLQGIKSGPIRCPETSVKLPSYRRCNNISEERSFNKKRSRVISGPPPRSARDLPYSGLYSGDHLATFRQNLSVPSSKVKKTRRATGLPKRR